MFAATRSRGKWKLAVQHRGTVALHCKPWTQITRSEHREFQTTQAIHLYPRWKLAVACQRALSQIDTLKFSTQLQIMVLWAVSSTSLTLSPIAPTKRKLLDAQYNIENLRCMESCTLDFGFGSVSLRICTYDVDSGIITVLVLLMAIQRDSVSFLRAIVTRLPRGVSLRCAYCIPDGFAFRGSTDHYVST